MKRKIFLLLVTTTLLTSVYSQASSDDDLFFDDVDPGFTFAEDTSSDDFLFGDSADDDFFGGDGIDEFVKAKDQKTSALSHGNLFDTGSIKIGGTFTTSLGTMTTLYADDDSDFGKRLKDTTITPTVDATLTLDARPTDVLRMYTKFGFGFPFKNSISFNMNSTNISTKFPGNTGSDPIISGDSDDEEFSIEDLLNNLDLGDYKISDLGKTLNNAKITDFLKVKELFTDFSVNDRAFFRFGIHTVTWGTGYFYSPVSDMINTSSINPEDTSAQVDGSLNLRTQITFPDSMNCLWLYVVPSTDFLSNSSTASYLRDTALAGKGDVLLGNWELGFGGYYRYQKPLKAMMTATGSIKKLGVFGETVLQLGSDAEWAEKPDFNYKTPILQFTAGVNYMWKNPGIVLAAQYYYDGNHYDKLISVGDYSIPRITEGHNIALLASFSKIAGNSDLSATVFGMVNFGKEELNDDVKDLMKNAGITIPALVTSAMISYKPIKDFSLSAGPYIVMPDFKSKPTVSLKLTATLGGGKF